MESIARHHSEDVENGQSEGPSIDVVLEKHIGELGRHQIWLFSIVSSAWMPGALMVLNMAFFGALFHWTQRVSVDSVSETGDGQHTALR